MVKLRKIKRKQKTKKYGWKNRKMRVDLKRPLNFEIQCNFTYKKNAE